MGEAIKEAAEVSAEHVSPSTDEAEAQLDAQDPRTACMELHAAIQNMSLLSHKDQVAEGTYLQADAIEAAINAVAFAVPAAFPDGLPTSLDDWAADLAGTYAASTEGRKGDVLLDEASLWFVSRQLEPDATIAKSIGRHENTSATIVLMRKSEGRPIKEKAVTPEQEDDMLDYAFRKEQIWRELEAADADEHHLNSQWADPRNIKRTLNGLSAVRLT